MRQTIKLFFDEYNDTVIFFIVSIFFFTLIVKIVNRYVFYKRYVETEKSEQIINPINNSSIEARKLDKKIQSYLAHLIFFSISSIILYFFIKFFMNFLETNV